MLWVYAKNDDFFKPELADYWTDKGDFGAQEHKLLYHGGLTATVPGGTCLVNATGEIGGEPFTISASIDLPLPSRA